MGDCFGLLVCLQLRGLDLFPGNHHFLLKCFFKHVFFLSYRELLQNRAQTHKTHNSNVLKSYVGLQALNYGLMSEVQAVG